MNRQTVKKRKIRHPSFPSPQFWDNLSTIHLTANALRELDLRNNDAAHKSQSPDQIQRCFTRNASKAPKEAPPTVEQVLSQLNPASHDHIRRSARHGGPDLSDLRGYSPAPRNLLEMKSSQKQGRVAVRQLDETTGTRTTTTSRTGSYNAQFESHLIDHNILPHDLWHPNGDEPPRPDNLNAIQTMLGRSRDSLSASRFTEHHFKDFRRQVASSTTETEVLVDVLPYIQGAIDARDGIMRDVIFRNLEDLTDGVLVAAQPDICFGTPRDLLRAEVRAGLDTLIVPSQQHNRLLLPNNFLEAKGPFGAPKVARLQAMYDAALGCRAVHSLQTYGETEATYDDNAYTLAWTYVDGTLAAYTCHPLPPSKPGGRPGYAMTHLKSWTLTSDIDEFRQAAAAFRNGRDWTRLQRENFIALANNVS